MICLKNVCKQYDDQGDKIDALKNIDLELGDKGLVFLIGESGSGKSTLLNCLAGFDGVTAGCVEVEGVGCLGEMSAGQLNAYRRNDASYITQEYNLLYDLTVGQNLEFVARLQGLTVDRAVLKGLLERVGLKGLYNRNCKKLSGGQKQRVAIARGLVGNKRVLFADEPTGNLNREIGEVVFACLQDVAKEMLVVVVSHDTTSAQKFGQRVIKMEDGKIVSDECNASAPQESQFEQGQVAPTPIQRESLGGNKQHAKVSLGFVTKLGMGIVRRHLVRFVAVCILPVLFFSLLGGMIVMFSEGKFGNPARRNLRYLYEQNIAHTVIRNHTLSVRYTSEYGNKTLDADGNFLPEQMEDYRTHGEIFEVRESVVNTLAVLDILVSSPRMPAGLGNALLRTVGGVVALGAGQSLEDIGGRLIAGQMPQTEGGVLVTDFAWALYQTRGYVNPETREELSGVEVQKMSVDEFLDLDNGGRKIVVNAFDRNGVSSKKYTHIAGIYQTEHDVRDLVTLFTEVQNATSGSFSEFLMGNMVLPMLCVVDDGFLRSEIYEEGYKPVVGSVVAPLSGSMRQDMEYFGAGYKSTVGTVSKVGKFDDSYGQYEMRDAKMQPYAMSFAVDEILNMYTATRVDGGLWILFGIGAVVTVGLLCYFTAMSVRFGRKQIGVIRSLGGGGRDIFSIYLVESVFSAVVSWVMGVVGMFLFSYFLTKGIPPVQFSILGPYYPSALNALFLLGCILVTVCVSVAVPIALVCKKKPIDVLRESTV
ncbi:MAG: ABC transporter ATP-binding protein/permease [Firmicutes bacterium]|nr:ABC transporter ATP-binding protein/permease [Bacillota bacterium]